MSAMTADRLNGRSYDVSLHGFATGERGPDGRVVIDSHTPPEPPLEIGSTAADLAVGLGVALLGLAGFVLSFVTVRDSAAGETFGGLNWMLPLVIDTGIGVFTGLDLRMAAHGMRTRWVRMFPWALNGITVYLNAVDQPTLAGKVAHAAPPILWVAAVEAAALKIRRQVEGPKVVPDKVPVARWFLSPLPTLLLWRRMRMWGVTSYAEALDRERNRKLVKARLAQQHGTPLRRHVPAETWVLYRMGELMATDVVVEVGAQVPAKPAPAPIAASAGPEPAPEPSSPPATPPSGDIEADARRVVAEQFDGKTPGRIALLKVLKGEPFNHTISNEDGAALVRRLKDEEKARAQQ